MLIDKFHVQFCFNFLFIFQHHEQVEKYSQTLETLLFTHDLDANILDTFRQFQALRGWHWQAFFLARIAYVY